MNYYKQNDKRWTNEKLGTCYITIGGYGCFITSLSMLCDKTPPEVNSLLLNNGGYSKGCLVNSPKAAEILGLDYFGKVYDKPDYDCIAETNYFASKGVKQHFFMLKKDGSILDPLGKNTNYPIVSYRLFKPKGDEMPDLWKRPDKRIIRAINIAVYGEGNIPEGDTDHWVRAFQEHEDWDLDVMARGKYNSVAKKDNTGIAQQAIADILACTWKNIFGKDPNMDSINKEAKDAKERYDKGERYAVNSYIDKYFDEYFMSRDNGGDCDCTEESEITRVTTIDNVIQYLEELKENNGAK